MRTGGTDKCSNRKVNSGKDYRKSGYSGDSGKGKLYIIGIGPGDIEQMSVKAYRLIQEVEVIVGYNTYIDLMEELIGEKTSVYSSGMKQEVERAEKAVSLAQQGKKTAIISSGDPGVYGMAGLIMEIIHQQQLELEMEVVPGITAANAAAAGLGAPLMHDYTVISLSDLLTPWSVIEKRLQKAVQGDFVIVLYNPKSRKRTIPLQQAQKICLNYRDSETPVGIVRKAKRGREEITFTSLKDMLDKKIDMLTTVIIGNSNTYISEVSERNKMMITPRGYEL